MGDASTLDPVTAALSAPWTGPPPSATDVLSATGTVIGDALQAPIVGGIPLWAFVGGAVLTVAIVVGVIVGRR